MENDDCAQVIGRILDHASTAHTNIGLSWQTDHANDTQLATGEIELVQLEAWVVAE